MVASFSAEELLQALRKAPASTKRLIVEGLCEDDEEEVSSEASRAWGKEIAKRIEDMDSGRVKMISSSEVMAEGRALLSRAR